MLSYKRAYFLFSLKTNEVRKYTGYLGNTGSLNMYQVSTEIIIIFINFYSSIIISDK